MSYMNQWLTSVDSPLKANKAKERSKDIWSCSEVSQHYNISGRKSWKQSHGRNEWSWVSCLKSSHFHIPLRHETSSEWNETWVVCTLSLRLRNFFRKLDLNGDGKISFQEFRACLGSTHSSVRRVVATSMNNTPTGSMKWYNPVQVVGKQDHVTMCIFLSGCDKQDPCSYHIFVIMYLCVFELTCYDCIF